MKKREQKLGGPAKHRLLYSILLHNRSRLVQYVACCDTRFRVLARLYVLFYLIGHVSFTYIVLE